MLPASADPSDVAQRLTTFWFGSDDPERAALRRRQWFRADAGFDSECGMQFAGECRAAAAGALDCLAETADGALALVLLLDQLPRNIYRGRAEAFAQDSKARAVAAQAIGRGFDEAVPAEQRLFFYLPFEHSEDLEDQRRAMALIGGLGDPELLHWAERHYAVIARFGRFPHRNRILGRLNTPEEAAFLAVPEGSF
ncbi:MAG: DUF924 domain-containing protein [Rhodospirillales bacterium]|nr:DUF924 domain-containing protein [Rhodospirillales bacterium]